MSGPLSSKTLKDVITQYVKLDHPNTGGWQTCLHIGCDHGKKGNRAAFLFENDTVAFHCFNCGIKTVYDPNRTSREGLPLMPTKMKTVLHDFGIPDEEWQEVVFSNLGNVKKQIEEVKTKVSIEPKVLDLPSTFYYLSDADENDKWAEVARWYLKEERGIDPNSYPFMLAKKTEDPMLKKWMGRVIIPIFKDNNLVFYFGRDLTGKKTKKYESPPTPKDRVLYGFDKLFEHTEAPLYIVEGWFDAYMIDGIAIFGNEITDAQITWLNRSPRKKVYIPDRFGDGQRAAEKALNLGWSVSTPDVGQSCKDMSDAVHKYGKMYVLKSLAENTSSGFAAHARLGVYCEQGRGKGKDT